MLAETTLEAAKMLELFEHTRTSRRSCDDGDSNLALEADDGSYTFPLANRSSLMRAKIEDAAARTGDSGVKDVWFETRAGDAANDTGEEGVVMSGIQAEARVSYLHLLTNI